MRASRLLGTALAYMGAGISAAIGIAFVGRFAYVTSDTPTDGAATAFLFAMVATGALLGPAIAIAVGNHGHRSAAGFCWLLASLAIVANWTHTLGAIAQRGAGIEAGVTRLHMDRLTPLTAYHPGGWSGDATERGTVDQGRRHWEPLMPAPSTHQTACIDGVCCSETGSCDTTSSRWEAAMARNYA